MPRISAILITRNEEANLHRCLQSLPFAHEIIIIDSGSTDRTLEIAQACGARVFVEAWKGYTAQKNSALEKATGEWIVSLDADEEFTGEAVQEIQELLQQNIPDEVDGFSFRRKVLYLGKWITHGDWYPDNVVRLWRKGRGKFEGGRVHESLVTQGKVKKLRSEILHYTYLNLEDQKRRMAKYSKLWALDQFDKGRPYRVLDHITRPPARFLRAILIKGGWLDGWRGWLIAWMCAREVAMKYGELRELWQKQG
jgi:glycosyltransferase involved in cell wall biosynthesis